MYLLQCLIVGAVIVHNEYNHWTPNRFVPIILGGLAAYLVTLLLFWLRGQKT